MRFILAIGLVITAVPAHSQGGLCGKRSAVVAQLESTHGERRVSLGIQQGKRVVETFANIETGTWTIITSTPAGVSCLIAAGQSFQLEAPAETEEGEGS